jgi:pilus assembly protein CpaF
MPQVIAVWSPEGNNTAQFSLDLARRLSGQKRVLLAELPCLGIPRLSFAANIMERDNHTEAAIIEFGKNAELTLNQLIKEDKRLALLASGVYAVPDYPVTLKVEMETLVEFPTALIQKAAKLGYEVIVLECQGQLTSPMTFIALKLAGTVLIRVDEVVGMAFSLVNIKRLIQFFKYPPEKFKVVSKIKAAELAEVMVIKDEEGRIMVSLEVLNDDSAELANRLGSNSGSETKKARLLSFLK